VAKRLDLEDVGEEFADSDLGDARLDERLVRIVRQLAVSPSSSFPELMQSVSEREAFYRFCSNERVTLARLLAPHIAQTCNRMERGKVIRIAHDTTSFVFRGDREGMGPIYMKGQGFFAHCALAITGDEQRRPLGLLGALTYSNDEAEKRKGMTQSQQVAYWNKQPRAKKRRSRWERLAKATSEVLPSGVEAIHVMDQEADDFFLLADLTTNALRFVVRGTGERLTTVANERIKNVLAHQQGTIFRKVLLSPRSPYKGTRKSRPERSERDATFFVRWAAVELPRTWPARESKLPTLRLTVVHVYEPKPPDGLAPMPIG
jgi:cation transport regulator ChaB